MCPAVFSSWNVIVLLVYCVFLPKENMLVHGVDKILFILLIVVSVIFSSDVCL